MFELILMRLNFILERFFGNLVNIFSVVFLVLSSGITAFGLHVPQETEIAFFDRMADPQNGMFFSSSSYHGRVTRDTIPWSWFRRIFIPKKKKTKRLSAKNETTDPRALFPNHHGYLKETSCEVAFEGFDPTLQKSKKELSYEPLFSHTPPEIKHYMPGQELLRAEGRMTRMDGGYLYLTLKFTWSTINPEKFYGNFKNKNPVHFELSQDKHITLYNSTSADWQTDAEGKNHVLTALYSIHPKQAQLFRQYFVMNMRIYWERGYQDYPVYNIGMIKDQLDCL